MAAARFQVLCTLADSVILYFFLLMAILVAER
jgi:hypothetical protein